MGSTSTDDKRWTSLVQRTLDRFVEIETTVQKEQATLQFLRIVCLGQIQNDCQNLREMYREARASYRNQFPTSLLFHSVVPWLLFHEAFTLLCVNKRWYKLLQENWKPTRFWMRQIQPPSFSGGGFLISGIP